MLRFTKLSQFPGSSPWTGTELSPIRLSVLDLVTPLKQRLTTMTEHWSHLESFKNHEALLPPPEVLISFICSAARTAPKRLPWAAKVRKRCVQERNSLLPPSRDSQMEAKSFPGSHGALGLFSMIPEVK